MICEPHFLYWKEWNCFAIQASKTPLVKIVFLQFLCLRTNLHDRAIVRVQGAPDDSREGRVHHLVGQPILLLADSGRANDRFKDFQRDRLKSGHGRLFGSGSRRPSSFEDGDESRNEFWFERAQTSGSLSENFEDVLGQRSDHWIWKSNQRNCN